MICDFSFLVGWDVIWIKKYLENSSVASTYLPSHTCKFFFKLHILIHLESRWHIYVLSYGSLCLTWEIQFLKFFFKVTGYWCVIGRNQNITPKIWSKSLVFSSLCSSFPKTSDLFSLQTWQHLICSSWNHKFGIWETSFYSFPSRTILLNGRYSSYIEKCVKVSNWDPFLAEDFVLQITHVQIFV